MYHSCHTTLKFRGILIITNQICTQIYKFKRSALMSYFKQISLNLIQSSKRRWLNGLKIKYYDEVKST